MLMHVGMGVLSCRDDEADGFALMAGLEVASAGSTNYLHFSLANASSSVMPGSMRNFFMLFG